MPRRTPSMGGRSSSSRRLRTITIFVVIIESLSTMRRFFLLTTGAGFFFLLEDVFLLEPNSAAWPFFFDPNPMGKADDFFRRASAASRSAFASASAFAAFSPVGSAQSVFDEIWTSHRMRAAPWKPRPPDSPSRAALVASLRHNSGHPFWGRRRTTALPSFWRRTFVDGPVEPLALILSVPASATTARWQSGCAFSKASTAVCASEAGQAFQLGRADAPAQSCGPRRRRRSAGR